MVGRVAPTLVDVFGKAAVPVWGGRSCTLQWGRQAWSRSSTAYMVLRVICMPRRWEQAGFSAGRLGGGG